MKFSIQKVEIIPHIPVHLRGFAARIDKRNEGVHDTIYASVVLLQENKTVAIINMDLIGGDRSFTDGIKEAIFEKFGLLEDEIILNFSHTHSAVAITGEDASKRNRPYSFNHYSSTKDADIEHTEDVKYYNIVKVKILTMIETGLNNLIEGNAYVLRGKSKFGVSRRHPHEDGVIWKPYFNEDSMDSDLYLIKLEDNKGNIRGLLYNYACHPTSMGPDNYLISADYPGVVRRNLEEQNPGMIAMFLQGCGADIKPVASTEDGIFKQCTFEELEVAGASLAEEIQNLLKLDEGKDVNSSWRRIDGNFQTKSSDLKLYSESWDLEKWVEIEENQEKPEYIRKAASRMVGKMKTGKVNNYIPYYISYLRLDDKTSIVALENEVVSDIGKDIKKIFHDENIITLGYSNSVMCYIPTKKVLSGGGYESTSFISAGLPGQFVDEVEDIIIGRVALMMKEQFSKS